MLMYGLELSLNAEKTNLILFCSKNKNFNKKNNKNIRIIRI